MGQWLLHTISAVPFQQGRFQCDIVLLRDVPCHPKAAHLHELKPPVLFVCSSYHINNESPRFCNISNTILLLSFETMPYYVTQSLTWKFALYLIVPSSPHEQVLSSRAFGLFIRLPFAPINRSSVVTFSGQATLSHLCTAQHWLVLPPKRPR